MKRHVIFTIFFLISSFHIAQSSSNYELLAGLVDSSAQKIHNVLKHTEDPVVINFKSPELYKTLEPNLINGLTRRKILLAKVNTIGKEVDYQITSAAICYSDVFKDGLFGGFKLTREATLTGNFTCTVDGIIKTADDFSFAVTDTIDYDEAKSLENISMPFTHSELPDEPLLPSLIEPAIAIAAIAITIILFFTVRSK